LGKALFLGLLLITNALKLNQDSFAFGCSPDRIGLRSAFRNNAHDAFHVSSLCPAARSVAE
jgi:hypothetical protein